MNKRILVTPNERCPTCGEPLAMSREAVKQHFKKRHGRTISDGEAYRLATIKTPNEYPYRDSDGPRRGEVLCGAVGSKRNH
jgi:hypothetical protein